MTWILRKEFTFEAAHVLPRHSGKCSRLHGHSWRLNVELSGDRIGNTGMLRDFTDISDVVNPILESHLDHCFLNDTTGLENPTSEELARWIYIRLQPALPELSAVEISETCTSHCRYAPIKT